MTKKISEVEAKIFRYTRYLTKKDKNEMKCFECDQQFLSKFDCTQSIRPTDFPTVRRNFYDVNLL